LISYLEEHLLDIFLGEAAGHDDEGGLFAIDDEHDELIVGLSLAIVDGGAVVLAFAGDDEGVVVGGGDLGVVFLHLLYDVGLGGGDDEDGVEGHSDAEASDVDTTYLGLAVLCHLFEHAAADVDVFHVVHVSVFAEECVLGHHGAAEGDAEDEKGDETFHIWGVGAPLESPQGGRIGWGGFL